MSVLTSLFPSTSLKDVALRFPIPLLCAVILFCLQLADNHKFHFIPSAWEGQAQAFLVCCFFACGGLQLYAESYSFSRLKAYLCSFIGVLFPGLLILLSPQWEQHITLIMPGLLLFLMSAAFIKQRASDQAFWNFNARLWSAALIAIIATLVLCGGISAAFEAIKALFDIKISPYIYSDVWLFGSILFAPIYTLSKVPQDLDAVEISPFFDTVLRFFVNWICAPLATVYVLILYAYYIKIGVEWKLPEGHLAIITAGFCGAGIAAYLVGWPFREEGNLLLRLFYKYFFLIIIVPILMMFVSIYVRLNEYGFTEDRYLVLMTAIWFSVVTVCFVCMRSGFLRMVPFILAALCIMASFGPWGAVSVSIKSQMHRFDALLHQYEIVQDGKVVPAEADIPFEDRKNISSILSYIQDRKQLDFLTQRYDFGVEADKFEDYQDILDVMGVEYVAHWKTEEDKKSFNYSSEYSSGLVENVAGYDVFIERDRYGELEDGQIKIREDFIIHQESKAVFELKEKDDVVMNVDLLPYIQQHFLSYQGSSHSAKERPPAYVQENERVKIMLIIKTVSGNIDEPDGVMNVNQLGYFLFIDLK